MKSLRTIRHEFKPAEPARDPAPANRTAGAAAGAAAPAPNRRRESRSALPGPSSGWRLPSGQLLVEYALQTCFTGSPFERSPFQGDQPARTESAGAAPPADESAPMGLPSAGLHRLNAAVGRESASPEPPAVKRAGGAKPAPGKARSRS
jgi:hypothetical protein